ncbi:MAG: tetratricopeptide repeat protein [Proteobacteria bacterium]|nr:tetratricopeptide repeat protein [Pseudomonadota bacterium]
MCKQFLTAIAGVLTLISFHCNADIKLINKLIEDKSYEQAQIEINTMLKSDSDNPQLLFINGVLLSENNKVNEAIKVFDSLTKSHPYLPEPYNNLAVLYAQQGDFQKAKHALEQSIKTHPSYATAHINLGDLYTRMASESYNQALQIDGSNKSAKTKLSLIKKLFNFQPIRKNIEITKKANNESQVAKIEELDSNNIIEKTSNNIPLAKVESFIDAWKTAWEQQNFEAYINCYSLKFKNNNGQNFEQWKTYRKPRVTNKDKIEITLKNVKIKELNNGFEVSFIQEYKSGDMNSITNKKLIIDTSDNELKIINEIS